MDIEKIINEIRNPFTEQLTEDEFDIVCDVHHWIGKLYNNGMITLEWRRHDEFWIRPIFEALNCDVSIWKMKMRMNSEFILKERSRNEF